MMPVIEVYRQVNGRFSNESVDAESFLRTPAQSGMRIIFTRREFFKTAPQLRECLTTEWKYPSMLWHQSLIASNGYAGSARHEGATIADTSWFQFLVKQLEDKDKVAGSSSPYRYEWYEMSFYIYAVPGGPAVVFCLNTPPTFRQDLIHTLNNRIGEVPKDKHAFLQNLILGELVKLYDYSIWTLRHSVRNLEKEREYSPRTRKNQSEFHSDFAQMHDLARHVIHTCEVIAVACDNITVLLAGHGVTSDRPCKCLSSSTDTIKTACPHNDMVFSLGVLRNFGRRAEALNERLKNEINLGFNLVVQRDSASMKTIAVVTLAFLPATFVSTIFSMSFFSSTFNDTTGKQEWKMSNMFWIYWVIAVPLTIFTVLCWEYTQRTGGLWPLTSFVQSWRNRSRTSSNEVGNTTI